MIEQENNKNKTPSIEKVLLAVLLVVAIGLGFAIYSKEKKTQVKESVNLNMVSASTRTESTEGLTDEEKILFYSPAGEDQEKRAEVFFGLVNKLAVEGNKIVINDCRAVPVVLKIIFGSIFTVENIGQKDINFGIGDEKVLVKAGQSQKVKADYKNGVGVYGYGCGDPTLNRSVGMLLITD